MIGCIIQARMGSTRLPGKVMKRIDEKNPILYYVLKQLQSSTLLEKIVVATTILSKIVKDFFITSIWPYVIGSNVPG